MGGRLTWCRRTLFSSSSGGGPHLSWGEAEQHQKCSCFKRRFQNESKFFLLPSGWSWMFWRFWNKSLKTHSLTPHDSEHLKAMCLMSYQAVRWRADLLGPMPTSWLVGKEPPPLTLKLVALYPFGPLSFLSTRVDVSLYYVNVGLFIS